MPFDVITYAKTPHLDENKKIPLRYLPDYPGQIEEYPTYADFPRPGTINITYVALDTRSTYRWSNTLADYYLLSSQDGKVVDLRLPTYNKTTGKWSYNTIVQSIDGKVTFPFANSTKTVGTTTYKNIPGIVAVENEDINDEGQQVFACKNVNGLYMTSKSTDLDQNTHIAVYPASRYMIRDHASYLPDTLDENDTTGMEKYTSKAKRPITIGNLEDALKYGLGENNWVHSGAKPSIYDTWTNNTKWTLKQQVVACKTIGANYHTDVKYDGKTLTIKVKTPNEEKPYYALASRLEYGLESRNNNDDGLGNEKGRVELQLKKATLDQLKEKGVPDPTGAWPANEGTNNAVTSKNIDEAIKAGLAYYNGYYSEKYKAEGIPVKIDNFTGDVLSKKKDGGTSGYELPDALYIDKTKWLEGQGEQTRANITIGSLKDAVVWDSTVLKSAPEGYPTEGIPLRIEQVDEYRRLKLMLATEGEQVSTSPIEYNYKNAFGLVAPTKFKGLRFTKQDETKEDEDTNIYRGRLQIDENRQVKKDDGTWKHNDILKRTGLSYTDHTSEDDLSTKVLTTKYINEIFKYGMGYFPYNDDDYKTVWLTGGKDDGYDPKYDEKLVARRTIAAQKLIKIKVLV